MLGTITTVGIILLVALVWLFIRTRGKDEMAALVARRQASSKAVGRAEFVEASERIPVIVAVDDRCFYYENSDLQASLDLDRIEEVEYDSELSTGKDVDEARVLRLRSHGHAFEFIMDRPLAERWATIMPQRLMKNPSSARAVSAAPARAT